jgi:hypothetical protein
VISDRFTKLTVAIPIADQTASTVAQAFVDRWMLYFGIPIVLLTDNGSKFASKFMGVLTQMIGIKHVYTSAYRPSTNGQVERFNSTLSDSLTMLSATGKDWDQSVGLACFAFNSSVHSSTGFAPFELACSRTPSVAAWTSQPNVALVKPGEKSVFRHKLLARVQRLAATAKESNLLRIERYKKVYDAKVRKRGAVSPGDSVLVKTFMLEAGRSPKLTLPVAGPYPVVELDGVTVVIKTREGPQRVHLDRVIRCPMDLPPGVELAEQEPDRRSAQIGRNPDDSDMQYVVDRIVDHAPNDANDGYLVRVRWAGYNTSDDTWEPAAALPSAFLKRYEKRKKIRPGSLLISPAQRNSRLGTANPAN